ncbi:MAG: hypothetical protein R3F14_10960 [Polyangiaceae bacterium]
MPASELELQREKQIQTLKHEREPPDGALSLLVTKTVYKGHPMANRAIGTEESVAGLRWRRSRLTSPSCGRHRVSCS